MAKSLNDVCDNFILYIYAFDEKAYEILTKENIPHVKVILFEELIDTRIRSIRDNRDRAEFCWSMTAYIIERTLDDYGADNCTYVDADMMFFSNPNILVDEMYKKNSSVQVVEHRFARSLQNYFTEKLNGRFCVEFNTFQNNSEGRKILAEWRENCFNHCSKDNSSGFCGDQKYLDEWPLKYDDVNILAHQGGGIAPWNLSRYKLFSNDKEVSIINKNSNQVFDLIFFHYAGLWVYENNSVNICLYQWHGRYDKKLVDLIYGKYIASLHNSRDMLETKYMWDKTIKEDNYCFLWNDGESLPLWRKAIKIIMYPFRKWEEKHLLSKNIFLI